MKVIMEKNCLCMCCMKEHSVKKVSLEESTTFKGIKVYFNAEYFYCDKTDEYYEDENNIQQNDIAMKNAYRKTQGLLTSNEIIDIRNTYGISQSDLSTLLGWGEKTITRYEGHQVQDAAHNSILQRLKDDPAWFIELLTNSKEAFSSSTYDRYYNNAIRYNETSDICLRKKIESLYFRFDENSSICGKTKLSLDKVVDVIRYFAASDKVRFLYKVKLVKMMWYADCLSYKESGHSITGLAYLALPMGAVPEGHKYIVLLNGVPCEEEEIGEGIAYKFELKDNYVSFPTLTDYDKNILDIIINKFYGMNKNEIIDYMHKEIAYKNTSQNEYIDFAYANELSI